MESLTKLVPGYDGVNNPLLSVLFKQTFTIFSGKKAIYSDGLQIPFYETDKYGKEGSSLSESLLQESELVAFKPKTDLLLVGTACSPLGRRAFNLTVSIQVENKINSALVTGNRKAYLAPLGFKFSEPEPFEKIALDYSLAYGGTDNVTDPEISYTYPKNPIGKGLAVKNNPKALHGLALPNIEDPQHLLTPWNLVLKKYHRWTDYPEPAGFSVRPRNFYPRYTHASNGKTTKPEFYNCAAPGLQFHFLRGHENICLKYMDPDYPEFQFQLPGVHPKAWMDMGSGKKTMQMVPQTIEILKDRNLMTIVWRGSVPYGGVDTLESLTHLEYGVVNKI